MGRYDEGMDEAMCAGAANRAWRHGRSAREEALRGTDQMVVCVTHKSSRRDAWTGGRCRASACAYGGRADVAL
jgi:hypothetical protein